MDSITEKAKADKLCGAEGLRFEANCAESWVGSGLLDSRSCTDDTGHLFQEEKSNGTQTGRYAGEVEG